VFEELLGVNPWTALFTLLNTLTIYFVAKKFLFGPVMKIIAERQQEIDKMYADAGSAKEQAEAMRCEYQGRLTDAQATSDRIVRDAVARGQAREEAIVQQAQNEAAAILDKAAADIRLEKKKAMNDAKNEISEMALAIAGKVVGRELNAADQSSLVDSFIAELGDNL
jgi:F-type H+-transporting ATPase subunit b